MRVKRGSRRTRKRRKILKQAKGYYGAKSRAYRVAKEAVEKSLTYAYRDRRQRIANIVFARHIQSQVEIR